jgi:hypothetical protein
MQAAKMESPEREPAPFPQNADPARKGLDQLGGYAPLTVQSGILTEGLVAAVNQAAGSNSGQSGPSSGDQPSSGTSAQSQSQTPPLGRPPHRRLVWTVVVVILIAVGAVLFLVFVPIPYQISGHATTAYCADCGPNYIVYVNISLPSNAQVGVTWDVVMSGPISGVQFAILTANSTPWVGCIDFPSDAGTCSFNTGSHGGAFWIFIVDYSEAAGVQTVNYSGSYSLPIL